MAPLVAITGATGFLGQHVTQCFLHKGWRLKLLTRRDPRLDCGSTPVELIPGSLDADKALTNLVTGADVVIHIAGLTKAAKLSDFAEVNTRGTERLAEAISAQNPSARFILVSSMAARNPHLSAYASSKNEAENAARAILNNPLIIRPCAIYGPGDKEILSLFKASHWPAQPMLNGKDARVCMVHVADVADAIATTAENLLTPKPLSGTYEVTDQKIEGYSWRDLIETACRTCDGKARPFPVPSQVIQTFGRLGDIPIPFSNSARMLTSHKAREILHKDWSSSKEVQLPKNFWAPKIDLSNGFEDAVAWYRAHSLLT